MKKIKKITCDRQNFIDLANGNIMIRNSKAIITHLGDAASDAMEAHNNGKQIYLTINGNIVSSVYKGVERHE